MFCLSKLQVEPRANVYARAGVWVGLVIQPKAQRGCSGVILAGLDGIDHAHILVVAPKGANKIGGAFCKWDRPRCLAGYIQ